MEVRGAAKKVRRRADRRGERGEGRGEAAPWSAVELTEVFEVAFKEFLECGAGGGEPLLTPQETLGGMHVIHQCLELECAVLCFYGCNHIQDLLSRGERQGENGLDAMRCV